ncbi:MAG: hypothetical protein AAF432_06430 [Planctomycetota bacterium]
MACCAVDRAIDRAVDPLQFATNDMNGHAVPAGNLALAVPAHDGVERDDLPLPWPPGGQSNHGIDGRRKESITKSIGANLRPSCGPAERASDGRERFAVHDRDTDLPVVFEIEQSSPMTKTLDGFAYAKLGRPFVVGRYSFVVDQ